MTANLAVPEATPHLGGYVPGGDDATFYPSLWKWLVNELGVRSVIDVGCGDGVALRYFADLGCRVRGVDGVAQEDRLIVRHDYTTGPYRISQRFDLAWSCEFVEHVEERFAQNFLATFKAAPIVLMTHAFPDQPGHHHVNCRPTDYWVGMMAGAGYRFDHELTETTRLLAAENDSPWNHFVRSGLAFRRMQS